MYNSDFDYTMVFEMARKFALSYSSEIQIDDSHKESIHENGIIYPCVPLSFPAKGNKKLLERLMASGYCSKMDGRIDKGKRIINVLLWIETDSCHYHKIN